MGQQPRPVSDLERYHARTVQTGLKLINALAMTTGVTSLFCGLALPVAFMADGKRVPLVAKYGRHYLLRYHAGTALWATALAALTLFVIMQPVTTDFLVSINFFLSLLAVVGYLAGLAVVSLLVFKGYRALRRRFDPGFDETPHEERLKG
ncbi:hypothetical protein RN346_13420 [Halomonas sp. PAMB 3232]|uniref:hypothetical protein n=1 Tax=Halomonas sp. PAMB 3232 TaxID=3075221 RepID=UPI00289DE438|nr:hypothetical protein [Halomonas sp. PAMB 3232]WNL38290.1 hypothetical protein RN346_13420 [Halomonas sp. PAMB 3232]